MISLTAQASTQNLSSSSLESQPWLVAIGFLTVLALLLAGRWIWRQRTLEKSSAKKTSGLPSSTQAVPGSVPKPGIDSVMAQPNIADELSEIIRDDQVSWMRRLRAGLDKTRQNLKDNISRLIGGQKLDEKTLEQVHEVLFRGDMGAETADLLVNVLRRKFGNQNEAPSWEIIADELRIAVTECMSTPDEAAIKISRDGPTVILVVGVNGVGKTTSIGKLAARYVAEGKSVLLCAGDTFRAAAIEQLQVWGDRIGVPLIKHQQGSDPASVAFDAVKAAKSRGMDTLLIDTAGRLHNKSELMDELAKIKRVIAKELPDAPHETWLVIDATTGQNAVQQVKAFGELVQLTGLIVTKLDGTAKGGVIIGIKQRFKLPIRYIGVGEKAQDLKEFSAPDFAASLFS